MLLDQFSFFPQSAPVLIMYDCFSVWDQLQSPIGRSLTDTKYSFFIHRTQWLEHAWQIPGECVAIIMRYCDEAKAEKQMLLPLFPMLSKWYLYSTSLTFMALAHIICEELGIPCEHSRLFDVFDILNLWSWTSLFVFLWEPINICLSVIVEWQKFPGYQIRFFINPQIHWSCTVPLRLS
jgi:hypothetical protein